jgi:hypothetical protein
VLLSGRPGIGKSTLLQSIGDQFPTGVIAPLYVDAAQLNFGGWSAFLWSLSQAITTGLQQADLDAPAVEKRQFVIRPQKAFVDAFWRPVLIAHGARRLILLLDHFDFLLERQVERLYGRELRAFLEGLEGLGGEVGAVLATSIRWECLSRRDLAPLLMSESITISALPQGEAAALIRESIATSVPDGVQAYLFQLTAGHPADLCLLAEALERRSRHLNLHILTHADVLAVLAADLQPADFYTPVYRRRAAVQVEMGAALA